MKKIVGIVAGKGGVGKSMTTVNIALALQHLGQRVGIVDADIYGPSIPKMIPQEKNPIQKEENSKELFPALSFGMPPIKMISMAYFQTGAMAVRAPIANQIILQFLNDVIWGDLDYLLIDFPPGTGDLQLTLMQESFLNGAILVTTPQEVALLDVRKAAQMLEEMSVPILGVIENMSYIELGKEKIFPFGKEGGIKLSEERGIPFLGRIPLNETICNCQDRGCSIFAENFACAQNFIDIVHKMEKSLADLEEQAFDGLKKFELVWKNSQ